MPSKKEVKQKAPTKEEGVVYVSVYGYYYEKPKVDAEKLKDCIYNNYLREPVDRLQHQIFGDELEVEVLDETGEPDEELSDRLWQMCDQNEVDLWSTMRVAWKDCIHWGCALFNPVWSWKEGPRGREYWLDKLRRLPPETFAQAPSGQYLTYSEILPGIVLNDKGEIEYYQVQDAMTTQPKQLQNVVMIKDPSSTELAGTSAVVPLVPIITMLDFTWQSQMQKVNRIGAPTIFIKVTSPVKGRDDIGYANTILKNWGKGTAYQLRENMEIVNLDVKESEVSLNTIDVLRNRLRDYFSPNQPLQKEGNTIGGNAAAEKQLYDSYIKAQRYWQEDVWELELQTYLDANAYEGYTVRVHIGSANLGVGELEVRQADVGFRTRALSVNEIRGKLGELPMTDDEIAEMGEEWKKVAPPPSTPFAFGPEQCGLQHKEHEPTEGELELEKKLRTTYEGALRKVVGALRHEEAG